MGWFFPVLEAIFGVSFLGGVILIFVWHRHRRRILWEDALKQIFSAKQEGRLLTSADIAGRLGLSQSSMLRLARTLESAGLVQSRADGLDLTGKGEHLGLHILRGHRLWERYLSDEAGLAMDRLHGPAERAEHRLDADELESLADHLGHPRTDPHGDVIPTGIGTPAPQERTPLTDWPRHRLAVVIHVEDEPPQALAAALHAGLRPGTVLRVIDRNAEAVICETSEGRYEVTPTVAAHIDVRTAAGGEAIAAPPLTLAGLPLGEEAEVMALSEHCTGLGRRRLLDLGFTVGTRVKAVLANVGDAAHAYRIRDTVIALRKEQAEQILILPAASSSLPSEHRQQVRS